MIQPLTLLYLSALILMAVCSTVFILWSGYHDNVTQRIGLSMMALSACVEVVATIQGQNTDRTVATLLLGAMLFGIGTWFKARKQELIHD
jgi:hypothetical protein